MKLEARTASAAALGLLSRGADGARLWLVVAALLAGAGQRFGRRAASRGVLSLIVAELVAATAKRTIRRPRPRRRPASILTRRRDVPTSSMPSAHAAAGFAFAVGAATELPVLAPPLAAAAGLVSYSRVRTGHHRAGDVAVGALMGSAIALATRRVWPVAPHEAAQVGAARPAEGEGPGVGDGRVSIVANTAAGPALSANPARALAERHTGVDVIELDDPGALDTALTQAMTADVVGVSGGDGTVNAVAHAAHAAGRPLLVVPGGTLNHFAHALGVHDVDGASAVIERGRLAAVDVARIAGRTFLNTASFGVYPELVARRERLERRIGKWPALALALLSVLGRARPVDVVIDGRPRRVWMAFIGNCRYHPAGFAPSWRERLDDGQLDVRIVDGDAPWARTRLILAVVTGRLGRSRVYEAFCCRRLEISSRGGPLRLAADGEVFDGPPSFTVEKADRPLQVFVP